jgi:surface carbohydrate biosynthesis protein
MKKKTIYIVIELKVREFVAKILFAYMACLRGYRVYVGSREAIIDLVKSKNFIGGIFFYKAGLQYENCKDVDKKINAHVVLDEEVCPGHNLDNYPNLINAFPSTTRRFISKYFYINNKIARFVKKKFSYEKNKIISSGWPRVDIFTKKFSKIFNSDVKKIKKKYKKYYLFVSDFAYITENFQQYALEYLPWGVNKNEHKRYKKLFIELAKYNYEDFKIISLFLKDFAFKNKSIKILIRGHPADNIDAWKNVINGIDNLKFLEPKDDIQPWIMASSGVLHRGCTTSLQAYVLGKPLAFLNLSIKNNYKDYLKKFTLKISKEIKNEKDLKEWMKLKYDNKFMQIVTKELI